MMLALAPRRGASTRNVVLVGHSGAGKTTLVESLLVDGGSPAARRIRDRRHHGLRPRGCGDPPAAVHLPGGRPAGARGIKVNLLDTPGYADFVGDLRAGLRAADAALFVISAVDGVDGTTQMLWDECAAVGMPRAIVITRLDHQRADFEQMVEICQRVFGDGVLPLYLPLHEDDGAASVASSGCSASRCTTTRPARVRPARRTPEHLPLIADARGRSSRASSPRARTRPSWTATSAARTSTPRC